MTYMGEVVGSAAAARACRSAAASRRKIAQGFWAPIAMAQAPGVDAETAP